MKRSLMKVYVRDSAAAVEMYREAFDAAIENDWRNLDGSCAHTELDAGGQIIAVSEAPADMTHGSGMQFCMQFGEEESDQVMRAYRVLKEGAKVVAMPVRANTARVCFLCLTDSVCIGACSVEESKKNPEI